MDQQKQAHGNALDETFAARFAGLAGLWAILFTIAGRSSQQLAMGAGWGRFFLQISVMLPVMAALKMTYKQSGLDRTVRILCRMMYYVMTAAMAAMAAAEILG